ncbi:hypothetical protein [Caballeronia sp. Lep1P3]|uniref:hypothetical protein n=1 Tax=Caballeronia sp. Lep1P3 TaxID=2878150 RepID=UPI001FD5E36E|nr:hypothetical protein [Caballeronia sp. Lep1P3]
MRSHLINGAAKSALDAQIMAFVSKQAACPPGPSVDLRVGLKNEGGALYRIITANGMIELIRADKFLASLGCLEEFTDEFDCLFSVPAMRI